MGRIILPKADGKHVFYMKGREGEVSDGYHTFDDLYEHRRALILALMRLNPRVSWRSKEHHPDDDPMFNKFFIVGMDLPTGQITYHYKIAYWDEFKGIETLPHAPKWDGHTPEDVVKRVTEWAKRINATR